MKKSSSKPQYNSRTNICISSNSKKPIRNMQNTRGNNRTTSTVMHTQSEHHQHQGNNTTKKNSFSSINNANHMNRASSCARISGHNHEIKDSSTRDNNILSKASILRLDYQNTKNSQKKNITSNVKRISGVSKPTADPLKQDVLEKCQQLQKQNGVLRHDCVTLQEANVKNKQKIQYLITRISQLKTDSTDDQVQSCQNSNKPDQKYQKCSNSQCLARKKKLEHEVYLSRLTIQELENDKKKWETSKQLLKQQYKGLLEEVRKMRAE